MPLSVSPALQAQLDAAADKGTEAVWLCEIYFPDPVGTRLYATRTITIDDETYIGKLLGAPRVMKQADLSALQSAPLNESVQLVLLNTYEDIDGNPSEDRLQDLMHQAQIAGALVKIGFSETRAATTSADIKWDGMYRVDYRISYDDKRLTLDCFDATLTPGDKDIGAVVTDSDFPKAPADSYGQVVGPVIGKVDTLPLVPVEVGLECTLDTEIDDQSKVMDLVGDVSLWPTSGYVQVEDEIIYYPVIDRTNKLLGTTTSPVRRGQGYPNTTPASHAAGTVLREATTGRESTLSVSITNSSLSIVLPDATQFPFSGVILIDDEAIGYAGKTGNTLNVPTGPTGRGAPVPTIPAVHNGGAIVRTIPTDPATGLPRYRYLAAEGAVSAVSNVRVIDQNGNEQNYVGGTPAFSQITAPSSGKAFTVVDLPARPRVDSYEGGSNQVDPDWITASNLSDPGVAAPLPDGTTVPAISPQGFLRWRPGPSMSSGLLNQMALAIDPNQSATAAIMKRIVNNNIFNVIFNAHWDSGLNAPRRVYGRFKDGRLKVRYQFDRQTTDSATLQVRKDGTSVWNVELRPPAGSATTPATIGGNETLPKTSWASQPTRKSIRLQSRTTKSYADGTNAQWINPMKTPNSVGVTTSSLPPNHGDVTDGDTRTFLAGYWNYFWNYTATPPTSPIQDPLDPAGIGDLFLYSADTMPGTSSNDHVANLILTVKNPVWPEFRIGAKTINDVRTGFNWKLFAYNESGVQQAGWSGTLPRLTDAATLSLALPPDKANWASCQSFKVQIEQSIRIGSVTTGAIVGDVSLEVEYYPEIDGHSVNTDVHGSSFFISGGTSTIPSEILTQEIALGGLAKAWARAVAGRDPWDYFSQPAPQGSTGGLEVFILTTADGHATQIAIGDVTLELEYYPKSTSFDGEVVADVDGRTGTPVGGGATQVLQHPVDVLAYLIDQPEFYGLSAYRDSASFVSARANTAVSRIKVARAIREQVKLGDLKASLCAETMLLDLFDSAKWYLRVQTARPQPADSVITIGEQEDPAKAIGRQQGVPTTNKVDEYRNALTYYYRRNYRTGDFRAAKGVEDFSGVNYGPLGRRHQPMDLHWHQSSRGYTNGLPEQQTAVQTVADLGLAITSTLWEYREVEVSGAVGERLQRNDVVTLISNRSGLYGVLGRVVMTERRSGQYRYGVRLQMVPSGNGPWWKYNEDIYALLTKGGTELEFWTEGLRIMLLNSKGDLYHKHQLIQQTSTSETGLPIAYDVGDPAYTFIHPLGSSGGFKVTRWRGDGIFAGKYEVLLLINNISGAEAITLYSNPSDGLGRALRTKAGLPATPGANGMSDTGSAVSTGELRITLGGKQVARINNTEFAINGNVYYTPDL